jgi:hypothetical protein
MPFGFVTQRQLDRHREELARALHAAEEDQRRVIEKLTVEWEEWFDKFRRLYARLSKRVTDSQNVDQVEDAPPPPPTNDAPNEALVMNRRRMRGF